MLGDCSPAYAFCLDPSCCFGTNGRAALAILGGMMLATAFPLLGAAEGGLQALLGELLGAGRDAAGLPGLAPGAGGDPRVAMHDDGSFSITGWGGYPAGVPVPAGPFRPVDLSDSSDATAPPQAGAPQTLHVPAGMVAWPVCPLMLGGSADDPGNWAIVTPATAARLDLWWAGVLAGHGVAGYAAAL